MARGLHWGHVWSRGWQARKVWRWKGHGAGLKWLIRWTVGQSRRHGVNGAVLRARQNQENVDSRCLQLAGFVSNIWKQCRWRCREINMYIACIRALLQKQDKGQWIRWAEDIINMWLTGWVCILTEDRSWINNKMWYVVWWMLWRSKRKRRS